MRFLKTSLRYGFYLLLCLIGVVLVYRDYQPFSTLMLTNKLLREPYRQYDISINAVSPHLIEAVIAAEDAHFCNHNGVDWGAIKLALMEAVEEGEGPRGASTITMQLTRNLFLWQGRSYIRKMLEIPLSVLVDTLLSKRRIMELYLNLAEWGDGIYGVEAAARHHFQKSAHLLSQKEAALLASALPSPLRRNPSKPGKITQKYANKINHRMEHDTALWRCVRQK